MASKLRQRITAEVSGDLVFGSIATLVVWARVAAKARHRQVNERRAIARPGMLDAFRQQAGRLGRIGTIAVAHEEILKRRQILGDVPAGRLHLPSHRDAKSVVLDIEDHREPERSGHRQSGPKTVCGDGSLTAENYRDRAFVRRIPEHITMIENRLRPTAAGRVL